MGEYRVNILLDTHVLVWTQVDSPKLGKKSRKLILDSAPVLWIRLISALEISRLEYGGRLELGLPAHANPNDLEATLL